MKTAELESELRQALCGMTPKHFARLQAAGIDAAVPIGVSRIAVDGDRYSPWGDTTGCAFIVPVRVDWSDTPESTRGIEAVRSGNLIDLLALCPERSDRWALRLGDADWIGTMPPQYGNPDPVRIWRSPVRWLQSGCRGLVMLTRSGADIYRILSGCDTLHVEDDPEHERELLRILTRPWPVPKVRHAA
jgi:hypothetical protein